jgi:glucose/arabinose dehydrogenase
MGVVMKKIFIVLVLILISLALYLELSQRYFSNFFLQFFNDEPDLAEQSQIASDPSAPLLLAEGLEVPWALAILPNGDILLTERPGRVRLVTESGLQEEPVAVLDQVEAVGEGGLLGIAIHPQFSDNSYVYLYYTYNGDKGLTNRVVRMIYSDQSLGDEEIILDDIPGDDIHNGGRIKFGPDNFLYIGTGDAGNADLAQDVDSLAGKILRVTDIGEVVEDNPFNNFVYSYGHRNPQGLAWDETEQLWATEHGPSAQDELNLIEPGKNYGWPIITGDGERENMEAAQVQSGTMDTWAPSGLAYADSSLFFGGLRGQALYEVQLDENLALKKHLADSFGRIRSVVASSDGYLYITTSNRDGRGDPSTQDDRLIKIDPSSLN